MIGFTSNSNLIGNILYESKALLNSLQPVFHISSLRQKLGDNVVPLPIYPSVDFAGLLHPKLVTIL